MLTVEINVLGSSLISIAYILPGAKLEIIKLQLPGEFAGT